MNLKQFLFNKKIHNKIEKKTNHQMIIEIAITSLLLALSLIVSFASLEIPFVVGGFLRFDLGFSIIIIALYFVDFWLVFLAALVHGLMSPLLSGSGGIIGALGNTATIIAIITMLQLSIMLVTKINHKNDDLNNLSNYFLFIFMIILTIVVTTVILVLLNKFLFLKLYGADYLIHDNYFLWAVLFPFNIINISLNILLCMVIKPVTDQVTKHMN